jgi:hypothetical protein
MKARRIRSGSRKPVDCTRMIQAIFLVALAGPAATDALDYCV